MQSKTKIFASFILVFSLSLFLFSLSSVFADEVDYNTGNECDQSDNCTKKDEPYTSGENYVGKDSAKISYLCPIQDIRVKAGKGYEKYGPTGGFIIEYYDNDNQKNKNGLANYSVVVYATYIQVSKIVDKTDTQDISHIEIWCNPGGGGDAEYDPLEISKTALTSYTRTWNWEIEKVADVETLELELGESKTVNYKVTLTPTPLGSLWKVYGDIEVHNPNDFVVKITEISDVISPSIDVAVNCPVSFPYSLDADGTITCTYEKELPDNSDRTNTATVLTDDEDYINDTIKPFSFSSAIITDIDECVDVTDDREGYLDEVCVNSKMEYHEFKYSKELTGGECGVGTYINTATGVANDSEIEIQDSAAIDFTVGGDECLPDEEEEEEEEGDVLGESTEVKGITTVVYASTAAGDRSTIFLIQSLLLIATGFSLIYVGKEYLNRV